ncbi:MAG: hypothetical protein A2035_08650 [Nitrospirae bacterium GWA2_42_11]|nr:MAG: hypothetical protein A2035_08650 [Nitrospirae bacterium GWA2_42_11]
MEKILINTDKYNGKYVALVSMDDNTIVGSGNTPEEALNEAKKGGVQSPFLLYVPDKDIVHIYFCYVG